MHVLHVQLVSTNAPTICQHQNMLITEHNMADADADDSHPFINFIIPYILPHTSHLLFHYLCFFLHHFKWFPTHQDASPHSTHLKVLQFIHSLPILI